MTAVFLTKHVALGNDFLIAVDPSRPLTPADAVAWCDRHRGIGADGLISLSPNADEPGVWTMVLRNSDGSSAEISGNGVRAVGQALARYTGSPAPTRFEVDTDAGRRTLDIISIDGTEAQVRADMGEVRPGPPTFDDWASLGVDVERQAGLDIGNPHLVAVVANPDAHDLAVVGPAVESRYPQGLNVHLISVTSDHSLDLRVWERGAGITEACGSGACAAAAASIDWGLTGPVVEVAMPGGTATVERHSNGNLLLTGPTTLIADIVIGNVDSADATAGAVAADPSTNDTLEEV
ncbi:MAG: diaminopimelate epimerase [Acidimicrobiales bacterium]